MSGMNAGHTYILPTYLQMRLSSALPHILKIHVKARYNILAGVGAERSQNREEERLVVEIAARIDIIARISTIGENKH